MAFRFDDSKNLTYNPDSTTIKFQLLSDADLAVRKVIMPTFACN